MAKLNWERAAQRSRQYDGMGYQDMQDARDERWFAREEEREARLAAAKADRAAKRTTKRPQGRVASPLSPDAMRELRAAARALGVDIDRVDGQVVRQLFGRLGTDARELKIDVAQLRRRRLVALKAGHRAGAIIDAGRLDQQPSAAGLRASANGRTAKNAGRPVKRTGPPPPISTKERLRSEAQASGRPLQAVARSGAPSRRSDTPAAPVRSSRPTASPSQESKPAPAKAQAKTRSKAQAKAERTKAAAARRGITVEQLVNERRSKAAADQALADEAKRLGITAKELRRRRAGT